MQTIFDKIEYGWLVNNEISWELKCLLTILHTSERQKEADKIVHYTSHVHKYRVGRCQFDTLFMLLGSFRKSIRNGNCRQFGVSIMHHKLHNQIIHYLF